MHKGNWTCSTCGGSITELPFEPRSQSGLTCRTCYAKQKEKDSQHAPEIKAEPEVLTEVPDDATIAGEQPYLPDNLTDDADVPNNRTKFNGEWKCAECGGAITSLPFEPRNTTNLKCMDCFKKSKE